MSILLAAKYQVNAAVYPFGRMDLVGHALIVAIIVIRSVPVGLAAALVGHSRQLLGAPHGDLRP